VKVVLLGATRGMGRALARLMAARGDQLFLLGRTESDLARSARDLEIHGADGTVGVGVCDLLDTATFGPALDRADAQLLGFEAVVVTAGLFGTQEELETDPKRCEAVLQANFTGTIVFCEAARKRLLSRDGGTLCVFSSVAGDRARKPVVLYGATKAGLSHYIEGLDHRFHDQGLRTVLVKPGFVKTGMTADLDPPPFAGEPEAVAKTVLDAIDHARPVVYAPRVWQAILLVIRWLPRFVMRRIGF
jgi:decaprenylphospho-beta-D-erythro-pentofuranosid-2-ulose 2-reductase